MILKDLFLKGHLGAFILKKQTSTSLSFPPILLFTDVIPLIAFHYISGKFPGTADNHYHCGAPTLILPFSAIQNKTIKF